jgi:hypothetical protein
VTFSGAQLVFCRMVYTAQLNVRPFSAALAEASDCALAVVLALK